MDKIIQKFKEIHSRDQKQLEVIFSDKKRIIVEAPAGYGKTKTMISRIAYLIASNNVPNPKKILALTFSVNAAYKIRKEISEKLPLLLSESPISPATLKRKIFATNYHGLCRRILKLYGYLLDPSLKNIDSLEGIDDDDTEKLTKLGIGLTLDNAQMISDYNKAVKDINCKFLRENYLDYIEKIKKYFLPNNYIPFNAILLLTLELFSQYPQILKFYRNYFPIIIVDEFQDTNILSWSLLKKLITDETHLLLMGDSLQRIYGFIGAIRNLMNTAKEKFNLYLIKLEKNYRFQNNKKMLLIDKSIRKIAENPENPDIKTSVNIELLQFDNQTMEAEGIFYLIEAILKKEPHAQIAILVRQRAGNKNVNKILEIFGKKEIPFFYALYSDEDKEYVEFHQKCLSKFLQQIQDSNRFNKKLALKFFKEVENIFKLKKSEVYQSLLELLKTFLIKVIFDEFRSFSMEEKIELVKDVLEGKNLKQYLNYVDSNVIITTIHGAKGLEWDYVILPDMERFSFPTFRGLCGICPLEFKSDCKIVWNACNVSKKDYEKFKKTFYEELNVFYVAVTRAKKNVFFTCSKTRINFKGEERPANISCFLKLPGFNFNIQETAPSSLETQIDHLVYKFYNLTEEEVELIEKKCFLIKQNL